MYLILCIVFFFKQKTAYEVRISDWSSDVCSSDLRMVGATTLDEYREYIEKDPALERRFQQVFVGEPSVEDTVAILRGIAPKYEEIGRASCRERVCQYV